MDTDPLPENDPPGERPPPLSDYLAGEIDALDSMRHGAANSAASKVPGDGSDNEPNSGADS